MKPLPEVTFARRNKKYPRKKEKNCKNLHCIAEILKPNYTVCKIFFSEEKHCDFK